MSSRGSSDNAREPSPFVTIHVSRKQAEEIERVLLWHATGKAKSHIQWACLRNVRKALEHLSNSKTYEWGA